MKKKYTQPQTVCLPIDTKHLLLSSNSNKATGTIHTPTGDVSISTGSEDDGEGGEASAPKLFGNSW